MKRTLTRWAVPALALPLAFAACDDGSGDPVGLEPGEAQLSLYLTDAPGDVAAVWVEIVEVTIQGEAGSTVLLSEPTGLIEVTELVTRAQEIAAGVSLPPGRYSMLRLELGGVVLESTAGDVYVSGGAEHPGGLPATGTLLCPGCDQSGVKVLLHGVEIGEGESALVLDFDVSQSFGRQAGRSGKWVMRPVIHTDFVPGGDDDGDDDVDDEAESIEGTVVLAEGVEIPACPGNANRGLRAFVPRATAQTLVDDAGAPVVRTGRVDDDGEFEIRFVTPDTYTLGFAETIEYDEQTLTFEATVEPAEVVVADDDVEDVVYTITAATCTATTGG